MKKIGSFLLALALVLSCAAPARAAETGLVEYQRRAFSFGPGSLHDSTDLFPELKDVMPGDVLTQQVKIVHRGSRSVNLRLYMKAEGSGENADFIEKLSLEVTHKGGHILYDGPDYDAAVPSGWIKIATLAPGTSATLDLKLTVPQDLGNGDAESFGTVAWKFKAEELPIDGTGPKTGDMICFWVTVLALSTAALAAVFLRKKYNILP